MSHLQHAEGSLDVCNNRFALKRPITTMTAVHQMPQMAPKYNSNCSGTFLADICHTKLQHVHSVGVHADMRLLRLRGVRESRKTFLRTSVKHQYRFRRAPQESVVDQQP